MELATLKFDIRNNRRVFKNWTIGYKSEDEFHFGESRYITLNIYYQLGWQVCGVETRDESITYIMQKRSD